MGKSVAALVCVSCFLGSCGGGGSDSARSVTLVHSYGGNASDSIPTSVILSSDGDLYGATYFGGANGEYQQRFLTGQPYSVFVPNSAGTVARINPAGDDSVLWNFGSDPTDGLNPSSLVEGSDGTFYGTTANGGLHSTLYTNQGGTVFQVSRSGEERLLWSFNGTDPSLPFTPSSLIQASDGNFYGVTAAGGGSYFMNGTTYSSGTVFRLSPQGVMTQLWSFGAYYGDAAQPVKLIQGADGNLYGISVLGGAHAFGTVFKITLDGAETVLWSFCGPNDGCTPNSLIQGADGNLYGTTAGGPNGVSSNGGTVFRLSTTGELTTLWIFNSAEDQSIGYYPTDLIQDDNGNLYGTTAAGGTYCPQIGSCKGSGGTLFQMTLAGTPTALWSFGTGTDGNSPDELVWGSDGHLYGVTGDGGVYGKGSLFSY